MATKTTTIKIEFSTQEEIDAFNADLGESLKALRIAVGSPDATVVAPGGRGPANGLMPRKFNAAVWHTVQRLPQD